MYQGYTLAILLLDTGSVNAGSEKNVVNREEKTYILLVEEKLVIRILLSLLLLLLSSSAVPLPELFGTGR